jgi:hypothetical protein
VTLSPLEPNGMRGYIVRYYPANGMKLAIVVGHDLVTARILLWRAATKRWTAKPKRVALTDLSSLTVAERAEYSARIATAIADARNRVRMRAYV